MAKQVFTGTVKSGPNAGDTFLYERRTTYGRTQYNCDLGSRGIWRDSVKEARIAAMEAGWVFANGRMVHSSAAAYVR